MHNPDEQKYVTLPKTHDRITLAVDSSLVLLDISHCENTEEEKKKCSFKRSLCLLVYHKKLCCYISIYEDTEASDLQ